MKAVRNFRVTYATLTVIGLLLCLRALVGPLAAGAQVCPTPPMPITTGPYQGSTYTYYLDGMAYQAHLGVRDSFAVWNAQNFYRNCSYVSFVEGAGPWPPQQGKFDIFCYSSNPIPASPKTL